MDKVYLNKYKGKIDLLFVYHVDKALSYIYNLYMLNTFNEGNVIMAYVINTGVTWVGKIDWELNKFHGDEYSTQGSSYNSYLIRGEKTVLIDTVWKPHAKEFVEKLKKEINLKEIDYIIANHGEIDHSGALPELMREIPNTPIYCTKNAVRSIKGHYHEDWNFVEVKTGDTLDIGKNKLIFI